MHARQRPPGRLSPPTARARVVMHAERAAAVGVAVGACVQVLGDELDRDAVLSGKVTPMFFGSARANVGVEFMLRHFVELAARPGG